MFNISVQTGGLEELYGIDGAYRMIKEAGFDAADANLDHLLYPKDIRKKAITQPFKKMVSEKDMLEFFKPWGDAAKKYGIENYQAHAPFPSCLNSEKDEKYDEFLITMLEKTIRGAASIGVKNLVVHPFFMDYEHRLSKEDEWALNIERYSRLIPAARTYGVTICLENMFVHHKGKIYGAVCSDPKEAAAYVDALNGIAGEKVFGFCFDVGHSILASRDVRRFMIALGDRITAFHVHDNDGVDDLHLQPYFGKCDWNSFIEGLKAIGFNRTLSFETFNICNTIDPEVVPEMLKFIASCGRMFSRRADG